MKDFDIETYIGQYCIALLIFLSWNMDPILIRIITATWFWRGYKENFSSVLYIQFLEIIYSLIHNTIAIVGNSYNLKFDI